MNFLKIKQSLYWIKSKMNVILGLEQDLSVNLTLKKRLKINSRAAYETKLDLKIQRNKQYCKYFWNECWCRSNWNFMGI
jgi:hypothetical protein